MSKTQKSAAYVAAVAHFQSHTDAVKLSEHLRNEQARVGNELLEQAALRKPDFAKISSLHSERQHVADRLLKTTNLISKLEKEYSRPGFALYNEANRLRDLAGEAAIECIRARLCDDFSGNTLALVMRHHPVAIAEDARRAFVHSPNDVTSFAQFTEAVPTIIDQVENALRRIDIYEACTATRALPDQKQLDAATPEAAKPVMLAPRRERTEAEEEAYRESLVSPAQKRLRELVNTARQLAEGADNVHSLKKFERFIDEHPEVRPHMTPRR